MLTDYIFTKLESQVERSHTNSILVDKSDVRALLDELKQRRIQERIKAQRKRQ